LKRASRFAVLAGIISLIFGIAGPAFAAPDNTVQQIRGQGSDTTIFLMQGLDTAYNNAEGCPVVPASGTARLDQVCFVAGPPFHSAGGQTENWDHDVASSNYPLGSGNGINLLQHFGSPGYPQIDYARSSSGPKTDGSQAGLRFVAYAQESLPFIVFVGNIDSSCNVDRSAGAVFDDNGPLGVAHGGTNGPGGTHPTFGTWPIPPGGTCAAATPAGSVGGGQVIGGAITPNLTTNQLQDIYGCPASGDAVIADWHTLNSNIPAGTWIPTWSAQDGSGTRSKFDSLLDNNSPGNCSKLAIPTTFKDTDLNNGNRVVFENNASPIAGVPDTVNGGRTQTCETNNRTNQTVPDCAGVNDSVGTFHSTNTNGDPISYTQSIYYYSSGHWNADPTYTTGSCTGSCPTTYTGNVLHAFGSVMGSLNSINPTSDRIGPKCSHVTSCYPYSRKVYNVYRNTTGTNDAPDWVQDYISPFGWICRPNASHETDPFTGVNYGTEIDNIITQFGFVGIPPTTADGTNIGQGVVVPAGTKCLVDL
jgi:ABC-type phosphate transport system substrate-binding protein